MTARRIAGKVPNEVWAIDAETLAVTAKMPADDGPRAFGTFLREAP
jgi:hypothetical protein